MEDDDLAKLRKGKNKDKKEVIRYKMSHPESQAELVIVSADTGVDNVLMQAHVRRLKQAVESLKMNIPFWIVENHLKAGVSRLVASASVYDKR
ncbi:hypothetical protein [Paenibacillus elgii]|nr:hypothetical protein [Paenibacillus elgii]